MAFDGLVTYTVVKELQQHIIDGKIDKIFEPNSNEVILGIYSNGIKYALDIVTSSNCYRMCLTTSSKPNPAFAPNFCMVLRKYLLNTRIVNIDIDSLERIVTIEFEGHSKAEDNTSKKLIIELMGKHSNIILVNSNNIIIDALKHFTLENNSYRNIVPNALYTLPISNKLNFMEIENSDIFYQTTLQHMKETLQITNTSASLNLSEVISNTYTGISKSSILSILQQLQMEDIFSKTTVKEIYAYLVNMLQHPSCVIAYPFCDNDYSIRSVTSNKSNSLQVNFFLDDYYIKKESTESFITYRDNLSRLILNYLKKLNQKLSNINTKLKECQNTNLYKLYGELITNNLYRISRQHVDTIEIENYYDNNKLITIPLDKAISPAMNAKKYFKKYNKLKNAKQIVELQKKEVETEINYLESIIFEFELASTISDIDHIYNEFSENFLDNDTSHITHKKMKKNKKQQKVSKKELQSFSKIGNPIQTNIDGFKVIVGKNNKQNDYITKQAGNDDIWFHTKDIHGSHVILKTENKVPTQDTINAVAALAAFYSKAGQSSNVPVDYTFIRYVKKPSKAKPRNGNLYKS